MSSFSKKRKAKNRGKNTGILERYSLKSTNKDAKYGMFNSSMRMNVKTYLRKEQKEFCL